MWVRRLELHDFRSYPCGVLELTPGTTVVLGANGQGKTNLVEAIGYVATLHSHRVANESALVRRGRESAVIRVAVEAAGRESTVELRIVPGRSNKARCNGTPMPRTRDVLGRVRCVLFSPEDLRLVKGEPAERRRFLDEVMVQVSPRYAGVRAEYDKALRQRTALLRSISADRRRIDEGSLEIWDERLAELGGDLMWGRSNAVRRLSDPFTAAYDVISPDTPLAGIGYEPSVSRAVDATNRQEIAEILRAEMLRRRLEELGRGTCLVGPHRDDLAVTIADLPVRGFASQGESWSLALALRIASFDVMRALTDDSPVLVLDDVFAELDDVRRRRLVAVLSRAEQILVTAAVQEDVPPELGGYRVEVRKSSPGCRGDAAAAVSGSGGESTIHVA